MVSICLSGIHVISCHKMMCIMSNMIEFRKQNKKRNAHIRCYCWR